MSASVPPRPARHRTAAAATGAVLVAAAFALAAARPLRRAARALAMILAFTLVTSLATSLTLAIALDAAQAAPLEAAQAAQASPPSALEQAKAKALEQAKAGAATPAAPLTALVVIDIQDFYFPGGALPLAGPEAASANAAKLLAQARASGKAVVHVGHNAKAGREFHADVTPQGGEVVLMKDEVNAFLKTKLQAILQGAGFKRLVICGMQTHMCVEAATRAAHDLGYEVLVVGDACATRDLKHGDTTVPAAQVHAATLATLDGTCAKVVSMDEALAALR